MPHSTGFILSANALFAPLDDEEFGPEGHLETLQDVVDIDEGAERLGLYAVLSPAEGVLLRGFLAAVPGAMHAAVVGAVRSALSRGLRTQFTWQPGYDHELRLWEVSEETEAGWEGLVNVFLITPHPPEATPEPVLS
jgi:hypothetical protein